MNKYDDVPEVKMYPCKDGTWRARFSFAGKRWEKKGRNRKEARQRAWSYYFELKENGYKKNNEIKFGEYFSEWMKNKEDDNVKATTLSDYERMYRKHIEGSPFDRLKVVDIERRQIVEFYKATGKKKTPYIANRVLLIISMVLRAAVRDEIIEMNPCRDIPRLKSNKKSARETIHKALTETELEAFLDAAHDSWYYLLFCFMAWTGTRVGEAGALEWGDIDYKNPEYPDGVIYIKNTATKDRKGHIIIGDSTKTKASKREIPINPEISHIITEQRALYTALHGNVLGIHDRVFQKPNGGIVDNNPVNREIKRIIKKMGEKGTTIHDFSSHALRDTFATHAVSQGMLINVLKNLLGHAKYQTTVDYYVQEQAGTKIKAMNNFKLVKREKFHLIKKVK